MDDSDPIALRRYENVEAILACLRDLFPEAAVRNLGHDDFNQAWQFYIGGFERGPLRLQIGRETLGLHPPEVLTEKVRIHLPIMAVSGTRRTLRIGGGVFPMVIGD